MRTLTSWNSRQHCSHDLQTVNRCRLVQNMETTWGSRTGITAVQTLPITQWNQRIEMTQTHTRRHRDAHADMEKHIPTLTSISNSEERAGSGGKTRLNADIWAQTHTKSCFHYRFPGYQYINKRKWKTSLDTRLQIHQYPSDQTHWSILWAVAWIPSNEHSVRIYRPGIILWLAFSCTETNALTDAHIPNISYYCSSTPLRLGLTDKLFSLERIFHAHKHTHRPLYHYV